MGHRIPADQETRQLRDTIREAHETLQDLRAAIKEARALTPGLVSEFAATARGEFRQLSNHLQAELNRLSAELNTAVYQARREILDQLTASELVLDKDTRTVKLLFNGGHFDDQIPLPYPQHQQTGETP